MAIIGIDLGTTNSLACVYRDGRAELIPNELGEYKTRSAVSVLEDNSVLVGAAAKERLVSHPEATAAALYHRYTTQAGDCQLMIVDFGGGTLDVSIVDCFENIIEITAIAGDNRLGGDDIDRAIVERFCRENGLTEERLAPTLRASLYRQAETAKIALSQAPAASIFLQQGERQYSLDQ